MRALLAFALVAVAWPVLAADVAAVPFNGKPAIAYKQVMVLPDLEGRLDIKAVTQPDVAARFVPGTTFDDKIEKPGTYWLRFTVENQLPVEKAVALFPIAHWTEFVAYSSAEGLREHRSGVDVPISERDIEVTRRAWNDVPFVAVREQLSPGAATTFHIRASSDWRYGKPDAFAVQVTDLQDIRTEEWRMRPVLMFFFGTLIALSAYHLILFFGLRDAGSAYYVMHVAATAMITPTFFGMAAEILFPNHPGWALDALAAWKGLAAIGLLMFARVYLETRARHKWLDKLILLLVGICALVLTWMPFGSYRLNNTLIGIPSLAAFLVAFVVAVAALAKRNPLARYFVAANVFNFIGISVAIFGEMELLPGFSMTAFGAPLGTTLEAILLARGLAYRMNMIKASEALVQNMLPASVAEELKRDGRSVPRRHEAVSILFTDFAQFTATVSTMPPARMVEELNEIFHGFDEIVERHGLEKIKTIGDAYMAAAGVPVEVGDHAERCVRAALDMQRWMSQRNEHASLKWGLRIGVHSGPVVAGVVGRKKYAYDIWGDTVNIASRMESAGAEGRVNISAYTYDLIRSRFECEYRGKVEAKGKGAIDMYFVVAER